MKIKPRTRSNKYTIDHNFFKTWSPDMAYIFGLWFSDGYICKGRSWVFGITLDKKDKYLLQRILKKMGSNHKLYANKNTFSISICSGEIVQDILNLGGNTRKSLVSVFPYVPREYLPDFIRGVFDGDGSIFKIKHRNGYSSNFISGSKKFIFSLKDVLEENICEFRCSVTKKLPMVSAFKNSRRLIISKHNSYCLNLSTNNTRRLRDFMYQNISELRMIRKYDRHVKNGGIELANSDKKFFLYKDAIKISSSLGLITNREWYKYFHHNIKKLIGIPSHPETIYKNEWTGWNAWLGK